MPGLFLDTAEELRGETGRGGWHQAGLCSVGAAARPVWGTVGTEPDAQHPPSRPQPLPSSSLSSGLHI